MTDPRQLGFDPDRLARIDKHLARYVDAGKLAGWQLGVARHGEVAHTATYGWQDREHDVAVAPSTIWRIASMTKPITSVTAMSLWEEGVFSLNDPISTWLPEFADVRVYARGIGKTLVTVPATEPIRVWHLLTHSSGLTAGFLHNSVVDLMYREAGYDLAAPPQHADIAACVRDWAALPLLFQPGTAWGYGVSTDVLGRLVEIWSGQTLDEAIASRVTAPLDMVDTGFCVPETDRPRLAALYYADDADLAVRHPLSDAPQTYPAILSGGGGLVSTLTDYLRFARMLQQGGAVDGTRVLAPRTLEMMTRNHLPGDLGTLSTGGFAETNFDGVGFGLGFAVATDPTRSHSAGAAGEYYWGGIFSTAFWVDPANDLSCVFMSQLMPSSTHPIRAQLRQLVYSALVG